MIESDQKVYELGQALQKSEEARNSLMRMKESDFRRFRQLQISSEKAM